MHKLEKTWNFFTGFDNGIDEDFESHARRFLTAALELDIIKFEKAPYWHWLDDTVRLCVFSNAVEFQTPHETLHISVKKFYEGE